MMHSESIKGGGGGRSGGGTGQCGWSGVREERMGNNTMWISEATVRTLVSYQKEFRAEEAHDLLDILKGPVCLLGRAQTMGNTARSREIRSL